MGKLTDKQEQFAQFVANGMSQTEAYRQCYKSDVMSDEVLSIKACEVAKNGKVSVRIKEIQAEIREKVQVSRESQTLRLQALSKKAEEYDTPSGATAAINAEKEINRLHGLSEEKIAISGELDVIEYVILKEDDTEEEAD